MRQTYTPIFRKTLTSRVWSLSPSTRVVWMWLQLVADPEGFVASDIVGVAIGANVPLPDARRAMEGFEQPDPDADPEDPSEGRVVERVKGGWRVLGFEELRALAKQEGRNARNRRYAQNRRDREKQAGVDTAHVNPANDVSPSVPESPKVAPPIPKPKPIPKKNLSEEILRSPEPAAAASEVLAPRVIHSIPDTWRPSESLCADATMAGVVDFENRLEGLRRGPIGGTRGVFEHQLDAYVRGFFGKWRTWAETDRARATAKPAMVARATAPSFEPTGKHRAFAKKHNIDLATLVREMVQAGAVDALGAQRALEVLGQRMSMQVRDRKKEAAA